MPQTEEPPLIASAVHTHRIGSVVFAYATKLSGQMAAVPPLIPSAVQTHRIGSVVFAYAMKLSGQIAAVCCCGSRRSCFCKVAARIEMYAPSLRAALPVFRPVAGYPWIDVASRFWDR